MSMPTFLNPIAITGVAVALTLAATGCQAPQGPAGLTIAATATSHEPAPSAAAFADLLKAHARAALYPGQGAVNVVLQGRQPVSVDLTPMRGDKVESVAANADKQIDAAIGNVDQALAAGAGSDGLDVLGVYDQALQVSPAGSTVVVSTSGFATTAPIDLPKSGDWVSAPDSLIKSINPADIPDATGRHVIIAGIGYADPAGHQPSAGPAVRKALTTLWTSICQASHAASCTVTDRPVSTQNPTATNTVPLVTIPTPATACVGTRTLSADVLFASNSPDLSDDANQVLAPIAASLAACPTGSLITAYGHTAQVPDGATGTDLSGRRARAVLDRLRALGVPDRLIGQAVGLGDSQPLVNNMPGGAYSETLARRNRVVELHITPTN